MFRIITVIKISSGCITVVGIIIRTITEVMVMVI